MYFLSFLLLEGNKLGYGTNPGRFCNGIPEALRHVGLLLGSNKIGKKRKE